MAKTRARNVALPGMEDRAIKPLQDLAFKYAGIRDKRIALNVEEGDLKKRLRSMMKKYKKTHYAYDGVEIELIPPDGEDQIKVRIKKAKDPNDETNEESDDQMDDVDDTDDVDEPDDETDDDDSVHS